MLRRIALFTIACILGLIFQAVFVHGLAPSAIAPDFITVLVVYIGLYHRHPRGALGAFCLGVLEDFASGKFIGPSAAGAVVAFLATVFISEKIYAERAFALVGLVFLVSLIKCVTYLTVISLYAHVDLFSTAVLWTMLVEAFLSGAIAPILVRLVEPGKLYSPRRPSAARESIRWSH